MAHTKGRRTFLLRSGLWVTAGLITAGTGLARANSEKPAVFFYEGNNQTQRLLNTFHESYIGRIWPNDEARSLSLYNVIAGTIIQVYDHPEGKGRDDMCTINVFQPVKTYDVDSFEYQIDDTNIGVTVDPKYHNGLDGKVSYVRITLPGT